MFCTLLSFYSFLCAASSLNVVFPPRCAFGRLVGCCLWRSCPVRSSFVVDLSDQWRGYRAAKKALDNILTAANITAAANQNLKWFQEAKSELASFLTEGVLTGTFVLHNLQPLVECMRKANVALRWRLLHRLCSQPKFRDLIERQVDGRAVIDLLLQSAQLEFKVRLRIKPYP